MRHNVSDWTLLFKELSPRWRPRLRLGLESLGLAQKDSLLLLMI
jgi:hypothetical protein